MRLAPPRGFSLLELVVVLLVLGMVLAGFGLPVAAQLQMRRYEEARRQLDDAREALLGFAAAHGRLPCPATLESRGEESFAPGGDAVNGLCAQFRGGYLPGAALGLRPLDASGLVPDPWAGDANRLRYSVFGGAAVNGIDNPLTRTNGMQSATLAGLGAASHYLFICSSGQAASGSGCGPATNQLTRKAAFVVLSQGPNGHAVPDPASDEGRNAEGTVFVYRESSTAAGREYDDLLLWVPVHLVVNRLLAAGRLP